MYYTSESEHAMSARFFFILSGVEPLKRRRAVRSEYGFGRSKLENVLADILNFFFFFGATDKNFPARSQTPPNIRYHSDA